MNIERLYEFKTGLILSQFPEESYEDPKKGTFTRIPNLYEEIADTILSEIKSKKLSCIFDDVTRYPDDKNIIEFFKNYGFSYGKEVYYFLNENTASQTHITYCLRKSRSFWHSLSIITNVPFITHQEKQLKIEMIQQICSLAEMVIVGAYDGEGYIFWQRTNDNEDV